MAQATTGGLMDRRGFLGVAGTSVGAALVRAAEVAEGVDLASADITSLQMAMARGELSSAGLTAACLARIEALDGQGPTLRSVIETNPEAVSLARAADHERKVKGPRGPLHGIPVLLKDNIDTADQMSTTAGSLALEGSIPSRDSTVAARLREAGAVLLGKANMSEWANFRSTRSSSGWSARGGQCRNPHALDRNPCGSSSGSAVAVAAGLTVVAMGTETDGSIVCPSSTNGIVGIKPTLGLVSRAGIIPIAHSQDTAGPMARSVRDAAILLGVVAGVDSRDGVTVAARTAAHGDYTSFLDPQGLEGGRIGVWRADRGKDPRVDALFESALGTLREAGATLVDPVDAKALHELDGPELAVLLHEFKSDLEVYLASVGARYRTLQDLIRFNCREREREMPFFAQELFVRAAAAGSLASPEYARAVTLCRRLSRTEGLDTILGGQGLDAIVAPSGGPAWLTDPVSGDHFTGISFSTPAAVAGYPHVTVPMGTVFGLPVGLSFVAAAWAEPVLLRFAYAFEQVTHARRVPRLLPTVDFGGRA